MVETVIDGSEEQGRVYSQAEKDLNAYVRKYFLSGVYRDLTVVCSLIFVYGDENSRRLSIKFSKVLLG
ncbi:hypothetical protein OK016_10500 [Vibrio chagasii]|nr:hypothetical protein [Vibrio chagasii]